MVKKSIPRVFIAATRQNDGKTAVSLGLLSALRRSFDRVGYMKPVGQHYKIVKGEKIDKDAVLMQQIFSLNDCLTHMSPIAIPRGFTEDYILHGIQEPLRQKVKASFSYLEKHNDFILIEGTGHAGVGSVFDMSNATVARLLGAKAILVSCGGIGNPIDEICLNKAQFEQEGVDLIGVIINKVSLEKFKKIDRVIRKGLERKGVEVLGLIPFEQRLYHPTIFEVFESLGGKILAGKKRMEGVVERFIIGDMVAHDAMDILSGKTLLISPGNRDELVLASLSAPMLGMTQQYQISGMIATYNKVPSKRMIELFKKSNTPLMLVQEGSFTIARKISKMIFKLQGSSIEKIKETEKIVENHVDIDRILKMVTGKTA